MSNTIIPRTSRTGARPIFDAFFRNGGFSSEAAMKMCLETFRNLDHNSAILASEDSREEHQDALALWALICVELNACEDDLNALKDAFDLSTDTDLAYCDPDHRAWFGQLAFNLFMYKWRENRDGDAFVKFRLGLWQTLKKATLASLCHRGAVNHLATSWLTTETLEDLLGQRGTSNIEELAPKLVFKQARKILESTAQLGCDEASLFLATLGFCEDGSEVQHLENASQSGWRETKKLARLLKAMAHRESNSSKAALCSVRFPVEVDEDDRQMDDGDYLFWALVAVRADLERKATQQLPARINRCARLSILRSFSITNVDRFSVAGKWRGGPEIIRERWEEVELRGLRLLEELDRPHQAGLEDATISALLATTRLIEEFLRYCFVTWPLDKQLHKNSDFFEQEKSWLEIDGFAETRLGHGAKPIKISELMASAGIWFAGGKVRPKPSFFNLFKWLIKPRHTCDVIFQLPEFIGANALASTTNQDHIFRRAPVEELRRSICVFVATYNIRNKYDSAHAASQKAEATEVIFWSKLVRWEISNLLEYSPQPII